MADFQYGKAIKDSFRLTFSNPGLFAPSLLVSIVSLLFLPLYYNTVGSDGAFNIGWFLANPLYILLMAVAYILSIILGFINYGWTLALVGQVVRKGKFNLSSEFRNGLKKSWRLFLASLLIFLTIMGLALALILLIALGGIMLLAIDIARILFTGFFVMLFVIGVIILILSMMFVTPVIALEEHGPIDSMRASFRHFRSNKAHAFALLVILLLFMLIPTVILYGALFAAAGSFSNEALVLYMLNNRLKYATISFFAALPYIAFTVWSFVFLAAAYSGKAKLPKKN